jgi:hypothetical protein
MIAKKYTGIVTKIDIEEVFTDIRMEHEKVGELETIKIEDVYILDGVFIREYVIFRKKPRCNDRKIKVGDKVLFYAIENENGIPEHLISIRHSNNDKENE